MISNVEHRRKLVAEMYLQGKLQWEIAQYFNVTQPLISQDLTAIRDEWAATRIADFDVKLAKELAKIDLVEEKAWECFLKSTEDAERTKVLKEKVRIFKPQKPGSRSPGKPSASLKPVREIVEKITEGRVGDARWLERVSWCIEMRLRLCGALKQDKNNTVNVIQVNWGGLDGNPDEPDALEQRIIEAGPPPTAPDPGLPTEASGGQTPDGLSTENLAGDEADVVEPPD